MSPAICGKRDFPNIAGLIFLVRGFMRKASSRFGVTRLIRRVATTTLASWRFAN